LHDIVANRAGIDAMLPTADDFAYATVGVAIPWRPAKRLQRVVACIAKGMNIKDTSVDLSYSCKMGGLIRGWNERQG
jgi:hypothetical protein